MRKRYKVKVHRDQYNHGDLTVEFDYTEQRIKLVSFGKVIAVRRPCKKEECETCDRRFTCGSRSKDLGERFIVSKRDVPAKNVKSHRKRKTMQEHIDLLMEDLQMDIDDETWDDPFFLDKHPSLTSPVYEIVDCWADQVKY